MDAAEQWEPDEARASRPVLRARGGEIPPRDSPGHHLHVRDGGACRAGGGEPSLEGAGREHQSAEDADRPRPAWLRVPRVQDQARR